MVALHYYAEGSHRKASLISYFSVNTQPLCNEQGGEGRSNHMCGSSKVLVVVRLVGQYYQLETDKHMIQSWWASVGSY